MKIWLYAILFGEVYVVIRRLCYNGCSDQLICVGVVFVQFM